MTQLSLSLTPVVICRSNPVSPDPRVEKIARVLAEDGYPVSVVGWDRSMSFPTEQARPGYRLYLFPLPAAYGSGMRNLGGLIRWQWFLLTWLVNQRANYRIIHACDFDTVLPAMFAKLFLGKRVVYDIFDFYADHLRGTPDFIKRLIRWFDLRLIGMVDAVILVDDARREQIAQSTPKRCLVIYNTPEDCPVNFRDQEEQTAGFRLRIAYVGMMQRERGLLEVIELVKNHPDWHLDLAGFGGDEQLIHAAAETAPNVCWHGRVDYDEALRINAQADVLFATYDPEVPNHRFSSPNKVFEAMMLGKPIIVTRRTNMDRLVTEADCGVTVEYGDQADLENAFAQIASDVENRKRMGQNARTAYESRFSWNIMKSRLTDLYATLSQR